MMAGGSQVEKDPETLEEALSMLDSWRKVYQAKLDEIKDMNTEISRLMRAVDMAWKHVGTQMSRAVRAEAAIDLALKDMDNIDALCDMAGVHRFTQMRADLESVLYPKKPAHE